MLYVIDSQKRLFTSYEKKGVLRMINKKIDKEVYRIDCHTHPLAHTYYPKIIPKVELTSIDKMSIESMIKSGISRGLDAIAITDHNVCTSGLYGKKYAKDNNLPIIVVPGCECSVKIDDKEIHILALGILQPFDFSLNDDVAFIVDSIHIAGGIAVLAHPQYYPNVYPLLKDLVDGVEYYNGVNAILTPGNSYFIELDKDRYTGIRTYGSDYHMNNFLQTEQRDAVAEISRENDYALWCRIKLAGKR